MAWRKIAVLVLGSFLVSLLSYFSFNQFIKKPYEKTPAALHVESLAEPLTVALENNVLGKTPLHSETLREGVSSLVLSSEESSLRTKINLVSGTLTVVDWDLGPSEAFSEGEIVWLERVTSGRSLVVFGNPDGAEVKIDDQSLGAAPISSDEISSGDHVLSIHRQGYKPRSIKIKVQEGYRLSVKFQLFLIPGVLPSPSLPFPDEQHYTIHDFSTDNSILNSDTKSWARGLAYFLSRSPESSSESQKIDYFFDYQGEIFDESGYKLAENSEITERAEISLGYLGKMGEGVTEDAKKSILAFARRALGSQKEVEILPTSTGWLRVRSKPSLSGEEISRLNVGDKAILIDEEVNWYEVRLSNGKNGWIAAAYAKKI